MIDDGHLSIGDGRFGPCGIEIADGSREGNGLRVELVVDERIDHNFWIFIDHIHGNDVFASC